MNEIKIAKTGLFTEIYATESQEVQELTKKIIETCKESKLSYAEVNKALYLADKGLYKRAITVREEVDAEKIVNRILELQKQDIKGLTIHLPNDGIQLKQEENE